MRILYMKATNYSSVYAATSSKEIEISFDSIDKPIIQLYGPNKCGKTVLIQLLHPWSSINLVGDERSDLFLILPNEIGVKNFVCEVGDKVYNITHTHKPTSNGNHTVSSSIMLDGEELNPSGGVTIFNNIIERVLGINKYVFQFIINGTQLMSFANMSYTQRKTLMNKAMGIDIYDKIHKMATEDYRYTNKLISSLNNTKEFLLSTYGSYETLLSLLNDKRNEHSTLVNQINTLKSQCDKLSGVILTLRNQNVVNELSEVNNEITSYENTVKMIGDINDDTYSLLVEHQIRLNDKISQLKSDRLLLMKDVDVLYKERDSLTTMLYENRKAIDDYQSMKTLRDELKTSIDNIHIVDNVTSSSSYLMTMISLAQAVNGICKEIVVCLNSKHLSLLTNMIEKGIDVSTFLIREGSVLMDNEREKSTISRIRNLINTIDGEYVEDCPHKDCIYWKTNVTLDTYFKSYQSVSSSNFTEYDMEQFDSAYKNIQTINRLIKVNVADELKDMFVITNILRNLCNGQFGIDVSRIQYLMEESSKIELRNKYISQLSDIEKTLTNMKNVAPVENKEEHINSINQQIKVLQNQINDIEMELNTQTSLLENNDKQRAMLSDIKHINIKEQRKRFTKLNLLVQSLYSNENEYNVVSTQYNDLLHRIDIVTRELDVLENANNQYLNTLKEIDKHQSSDNKSRIIAEATSSTKGKPVISIREKIDEALLMANRLLNIMYDGDMELLRPVVDETTFALPFRSGSKEVPDIRYGSQSESSLLSFALSLSLSSLLATYNIPLVDEMDAYLDGHMRDSFMLMLQEIMATLKMEQMFIISHNITVGQYDHIVHCIDVSKL